MAIGTNLLQFAKTTTFQSAVCSIIANLNTVSEDLREARAAFVQWDTNNDGVISESEV